MTERELSAAELERFRQAFHDAEGTFPECCEQVYLAALQERDAEVERLRESIERAIAIGSKPWTEMGGEWKSDLRKRGQSMLNILTAALNEKGDGDG